MSGNTTGDKTLGDHIDIHPADVDAGGVGVVAVRSRSGPVTGRACWAVMEKYAALIAKATPMRAIPLPLTQSDPAAVAAQICRLRCRVGAVLLVGLDPSAAACVRRAARTNNGPPVITELDVVTAVLGAATMSFLRCRDITRKSARIVMTGADAAPRLGPLLVALGAGSMTTWHPFDAGDHPLHRMMADHDLLIDLAGSAPDDAAPGRTLSMPSERYDYGALLIPGLLRGLCRHEHPPVTIEVLASCSRALALVTAAGRILPATDERLLVPAVARYVDRALGEVYGEARRADR